MIKCPSCDVGGLLVRRGVDKVTIGSTWQMWLVLGSTCKCGSNDHLEKIYVKPVFDGLPDVVFCYDESTPQGEIAHLMGLE